MEANLKYLLGRRGVINMTAGDEVTDSRIGCVQVIADAVFETFEENLVDAAGSAVMTTITHPAERMIFGDITALKVTSGTVRCYLV
jgi:hypothetical protein